MPGEIRTNKYLFVLHVILFLGAYTCYAKNDHGIAASNTVFVRQSTLNNFKEEPPITMSVEEGGPFKLPCQAPAGWPKPSVYWMIQVIFLQLVLF